MDARESDINDKPLKSFFNDSGELLSKEEISCIEEERVVDSIEVSLINIEKRLLELEQIQLEAQLFLQDLKRDSLNDPEAEQDS